MITYDVRGSNDVRGSDEDAQGVIYIEIRQWVATAEVHIETFLTEVLYRPFMHRRGMPLLILNNNNMKSRHDIVNSLSKKKYF